MEQQSRAGGLARSEPKRGFIIGIFRSFRLSRPSVRLPALLYAKIHSYPSSWLVRFVANSLALRIGLAAVDAVDMNMEMRIGGLTRSGHYAGAVASAVVFVVSAGRAQQVSRLVCSRRKAA